MFERNDVDMWRARVVSLETQHRNLDDTALQVMRMQRTVLSHSLVHSRIASRHVTKSAQRRANCASASVAMILGSHAAPAWEVPHRLFPRFSTVETSDADVQALGISTGLCPGGERGGQGLCVRPNRCAIEKPPRGKSPRTSATRWVSS